MNADDQPLGEYPPINMFDLVPMELRMRALIAMQAACETLASFTGFDVFPSLADEFAALLRVPIAS
ncbi:MAG: hypothetical protein ACRDTI_06605 [Mycobacterium sp.]